MPQGGRSSPFMGGGADADGWRLRPFLAVASARARILDAIATQCEDDAVEEFRDQLARPDR